MRRFINNILAHKKNNANFALDIFIIHFKFIVYEIECTETTDLADSHYSWSDWISWRICSDIADYWRVRFLVCVCRICIVGNRQLCERALTI